MITLSEMKRHSISFQIILKTIPKNGEKINFAIKDTILKDI